ncbi:MAG: hypothetical protein M1587_05290 [Thaumarchaeota archaeon]|nr:hypothetical protein [Nitrososphaerota archaeon]
MERKEKKAISPIIATLLLILIAIAAGVVVYAYVIGFIGNSTSNSGATTNTLSIDQVTFSSKASNFPVVAYVRNEGPSTESFNTGFFVKGSSLNDQLAPAVQISTSTSSIEVTAVTLAASSGDLVVTLTCSGSATVAVSAFGQSGSVSCTTSPASTSALVVNGLTFASSPSTGNIGSLGTLTIPISTSASSPTTIGVPLATGATISETINNVGQFTLTAPTSNSSSTAALLSLTAGATYTVQVTGTDGGSAVASAKAS